ncbi:MAG: hypothetical protein HMLIMOIP_002053 [Candidatus Nitrosomirales archaeon]|jgi:hypothetical protein
MKLTMLREHYRSNDGGKTWIPKVPFDTKEDIKEEEFPSHSWHTYTCYCGKLHVASNRKEEINDN